MSEHNCIQEKNIDELSSLLKRLIIQIYGDGKEGLVVTVPRLEDKINTLIATIAAQTTVISNLLNFQSEIVGVEKYKEKERMPSLYKTAIWVSGIIGVSGIICVLVIKFA